MQYLSIFFFQYLYFNGYQFQSEDQIETIVLGFGIESNRP